MIGETYRKLLPLKVRLKVRGLLGRSESRSEEPLNLGRQLAAFRYLKGEGIEIGALHLPLQVPQVAKVKYVDRLSVAELRKQYEELSNLELVNPDIIADGELLETIQDSSQDFVIANHFIEHSQNPLMALTNMFRVLRDEGILYLAIPDKRYTFDVDRPVTTLDHVLTDYAKGPAWSKRDHFEEWVRLVNKTEDSVVQDRMDELLRMDYSIHFHVWTQREMWEMLAALRSKLDVLFDIELFLKNGEECIFILRKEGSRHLAATNSSE
ncbi:MAG: hypothetical protein QOH71_689 [Blastocatellia bacterium]|jgi:predicted SAM-dependent methyltransferase|nr:hypothetical protein [Blastocatellia bacterium]